MLRIVLSFCFLIICFALPIHAAQPVKDSEFHSLTFFQPTNDNGPRGIGIGTNGGLKIYNNYQHKVTWPQRLISQFGLVYTTFQTAEVYLGSDNVLDNPVIIFEGYDPNNENNFSTYWNNFNLSNLGQKILNTGRDIIFVNYEDGGADIETLSEHAAILIENIGLIAQNNNKKLAVIGISMGGLVARMALANLEQAGVNHNTALYITYDSPHRGANIPIDIINQVNRIEDKVDVSLCGLVSKCRKVRSDLRKVQKQWKSDAAQQMLVTSQGAASFYQNLQQLGHPSQLRSVAFSNGSGNGKTLLRLTDNKEVLNYTVDYVGIIQGNNETYSLKTHSLGSDYKSFFLYSTSYFDKAPGGVLDSFFQYKSQIEQTANSRINSKSNDNFHSFVPTVSALDLTTQDLTEVVSGVYTPFDKVYHAGSNNLSHTNISYHANALFSELVLHH